MNQQPDEAQVPDWAKPTLEDQQSAMAEEEMAQLAGQVEHLRKRLLRTNMRTRVLVRRVNELEAALRDTAGDVE